jgi:hypothetical protein
MVERNEGYGQQPLLRHSAAPHPCPQRCVGALEQRRAARAVARPAAKNRMDGALGRYSDIAAEPPDQELANFTRAPVRLLGLQPDNQAFNCSGSWLA